MKWLFLLIGLGIALLVGVLWFSKNGEEGFSLAIEDVLLGTPREGEDNKPDPKLTTKDAYTTDEPVAMRIITSLKADESLIVQARLQTQTGEVRSLTPSNITLGPDRNTFCCWNFSEAGDFTIQLFRPDQTVVSLPIKIVD